MSVGGSDGPRQVYTGRDNHLPRCGSLGPQQEGRSRSPEKDEDVRIKKDQKPSPFRAKRSCDGPETQIGTETPKTLTNKDWSDLTPREATVVLSSHVPFMCLVGNLDIRTDLGETTERMIHSIFTSTFSHWESRRDVSLGKGLPVPTPW